MIPVQPVLPNQPRTREYEVVYAKDQPQYQPLPVVKVDDGTVISRWQLSWKERFRILLTGNFFFQQLTFNSPLQPILPTVEEPQLTFRE